MPGKSGLLPTMKTLLFVSAGLLTAVVRAGDLAPDVLVKTISEEVIEIIKRDKEIQAGNPKKIADLVETKILPHFDFTRMTRIAMARNWRLASPEQQNELTKEFKTLLVRTYSTALTSYRDRPEDTEVTVRSEVRQPGAQPVSIDYEMEKTPDSWKVYDVKIGGVSLVTTYRETFAAEVREHGVDGLIKSLVSKNSQSESRSASGKT